jgi:flavin-binding protein dodecin
MAVVKCIELLGSSSQSWSDAAREAVRVASKSLDNIVSLDVSHSEAKVENNQITEYRVRCTVCFLIDESKLGQE